MTQGGIMRYVAVLQRFDDAHVDVAESDVREEVVAAAVAVYTALVPTVLAEGGEFLKQQRRSDLEDESEDALNYQRDGISGRLRAKEWGVGVYEGTDLVYWIGATREKPRL
jgi:hypothetical protein